MSRGRLRRFPGSPRDAGATLSCWGWQLAELRRRAELEGVTISRYLNELLWRDWLHSPDAPAPSARKRARAAARKGGRRTRG